MDHGTGGVPHQPEVVPPTEPSLPPGLAANYQDRDDSRLREQKARSKDTSSEAPTEALALDSSTHEPPAPLSAEGIGERNVPLASELLGSVATPGLRSDANDEDRRDERRTSHDPTTADEPHPVPMLTATLVDDDDDDDATADEGPPAPRVPVAATAVGSPVVDPGVQNQRVAMGLCPECGARLFEMKREGWLRVRDVLVPLDVAGVADGGRCLRCHPVPSGPSDPDRGSALEGQFEAEGDASVGALRSSADPRRATWRADMKRHRRKAIGVGLVLILASVAVAVGIIMGTKEEGNGLEGTNTTPTPTVARPFSVPPSESPSAPPTTNPPLVDTTSPSTSPTTHPDVAQDTEIPSTSPTTHPRKIATQPPSTASGFV